MEQRILISIIIPVYNREASIKAMLDTILQQEDEQCELIIVDDGSNDKTYLLCKEMKGKFRMHVELLQKNNGGVSSARNAGLEKARGKYVCFIDSDDMIDNNYIASIKEICKTGYELYEFRHRVGNEKDGFIEECSCLQEGDIKINDYYKHILAQQSNPPWNKVYLNEIIKKNHILFDTSLTIAEDICFTLRFLEFCGNCYISNVILYNYYLNPNGLCRSVNLNYLKDNNKLFIQMKKFIETKKLSKEYYQIATKYMLRSFFRNVGRLRKKGVKNKQISYALNMNGAYTEVMNVELDDWSDKIRRILLKNEMYMLIVKIIKG